MPRNPVKPRNPAKPRAPAQVRVSAKPRLTTVYASMFRPLKIKPKGPPTKQPQGNRHNQAKMVVFLTLLSHHDPKLPHEFIAQELKDCIEDPQNEYLFEGQDVRNSWSRVKRFDRGWLPYFWSVPQSAGLTGALQLAAERRMNWKIIPEEEMSVEGFAKTLDAMLHQGWAYAQKQGQHSQMFQQNMGIAQVQHQQAQMFPAQYQQSINDTQVQHDYAQVSQHPYEREHQTDKQTEQQTEHQFHQQTMMTPGGEYDFANSQTKYLQCPGSPVRYVPLSEFNKHIPEAPDNEFPGLALVKAWVDSDQQSQGNQIGWSLTSTDASQISGHHQDEVSEANAKDELGGLAPMQQHDSDKRLDEVDEPDTNDLDKLLDELDELNPDLLDDIEAQFAHPE